MKYVMQVQCNYNKCMFAHAKEREVVPDGCHINNRIDQREYRRNLRLIKLVLVSIYPDSIVPHYYLATNRAVGNQR